MNDVFLFLLGIAAGTYYAESVREVAPILEPNKNVQT